MGRKGNALSRILGKLTRSRNGNVYGRIFFWFVAVNTRKNVKRLFWLAFSRLR